MKNKVCIIGGFRLPEGTASAVRAYGNAMLLEKIGFHPIIVGKFVENPLHNVWRQYRGMDCFNIECENDQYGKTVRFMERLMEDIPSEDIHSLIVYNFPGKGLEQLRKLAVKYGIGMISDTTEWYAFEGKNLVSAIRRKIQTEYRMRVVNKRMDHMICSTYYIADYYKKLNTIVIPMIDDKSFGEEPKPLYTVNRIRRYIYAGSPGYKFKKDKINVIIQGFERLREKGIPFQLDIYGITKEQYQDAFGFEPGCDERCRVLFHGCVPRAVIDEALETTDFYVLYRPNTKVCKVGFSTKAMEAISNGVPLISNDVNGDFQRYFTQGQALICAAKDEDRFYRLLEESALMSEDDVLRMKKSCTDNNPFHFRNYVDSMRDFMKRVVKND